MQIKYVMKTLLTANVYFEFGAIVIYVSSKVRNKIANMIATFLSNMTNKVADFIMHCYYMC